MAFLYYGAVCLFSFKMQAEFERYGLSKFRKLTGLLEMAGALGQLIGFGFKPLQSFSSLGLALLMGMGVFTRMRIKDPFLSWIPALVLGGINIYLFMVSF